MDPTFIKEKEKPQTHLLLAQKPQRLHLLRLQHPRHPPRRKKHKKQMKYQKNLNQTLQKRHYHRQTHYPLTVRILFRTYPSNNTLNFIISCFVAQQHYIPRLDRQLVFLFLYVYYNKFYKKTTRVKTWVKISKVMPQPKSISPGKGREALWQKVQISRLKYGTA